ncbi:hypothetical protein PFLmoz3_05239 [Pseudomonas fluorescens]|uniref:Uncharacterized protein n=1 Tax=Pseudomonas fluorescens TaxID=294 RepID=A0A120G651_PSEFL|nr:hypothetical protein PFLmoz3_05239 [Pseudomonas fluorescens]
MFGHRQHHTARGGATLSRLGAFFGGGGWRYCRGAVVGQTQLVADAEQANRRDDHLRRLLGTGIVLAQEQQDIHVVAGAQLATGTDDLVDGDGERAFIRTNHAGQGAAGGEAFIIEPSAGTQGPQRRTTDGLVNAGQAACRHGAQFFHGYIGSGEGHKRRNRVHQYHDGLAGLVFHDRNGFFHGNDRLWRGCYGRCRWTAEHQAPIPCHQGSDKQQASQDHADATVHDGAPYPVALLLFPLIQTS